VLHTGTRKLARFGRSMALTIPDFAVRKIGAVKGDTFVVIFDDVTGTVMYQRMYPGMSAPKITFNGVTVESQLLP
jgi:hypothetical protein